MASAPKSSERRVSFASMPQRQAAVTIACQSSFDAVQHLAGALDRVAGADDALRDLGVERSLQQHQLGRDQRGGRSQQRPVHRRGSTGKVPSLPHSVGPSISRECGSLPTRRGSKAPLSTLTSPPAPAALGRGVVVPEEQRAAVVDVRREAQPVGDPDVGAGRSASHPGTPSAPRRRWPSGTARRDAGDLRRRRGCWRSAPAAARSSRSP